MTLQQFENNLKTACPETYELAAPQNAKYGASSSFGDDRNMVDLPKVQIDIVSNVLHDFLVDDVCAALWAMDLTYSIQSEGYDPDYNAYRTILQLVVV